MNIYLDIDGVILANDREPARHVNEFLEFVVNKYPVYWLTTHCKGDASYTIHHLGKWLDHEALRLAAKIRSTKTGRCQKPRQLTGVLLFCGLTTRFLILKKRI